MVIERRTSRDIRSESRLDVLHALLARGESTRNELAQVTGLSTATVATVVTDLIAAGVVTEVRRDSGGIGRPTTHVAIDASRGFFVGVDLAETYVRAVVFDGRLAEVGRTDVASEESRSAPAAVADLIGSAVDQAIASAGVPRERVLGVGVSLPGMVQRAAGLSAVVPEWAWHDVDLAGLRDRVGFPLVVDNPLKAIAVAELWFGVGREAPSTITINLGTGVGAGIVLDGRVLHGATNTAGEWGHTLLVLDGRRCRCGRDGCVESYIGSPGIQATLAEVDPNHPLVSADSQTAFVDGLAEAAAAGDAGALEAVARTARYLGSAIADLVAVLNPHQVVLTGWTAWSLGDLLIAPTRDRVRTESPGESATDLRVQASRLRTNPAATGIATLALERDLRDAGLLTTQLSTAL